MKVTRFYTSYGWSCLLHRRRARVGRARDAARTVVEQVVAVLKRGVLLAARELDVIDRVVKLAAALWLLGRSDDAGLADFEHLFNQPAECRLLALPSP